MTPDQLIKMYEMMLITRNILLADKCTRQNERDIAQREKALIEGFINNIKFMNISKE